MKSEANLTQRVQELQRALEEKPPNELEREIARLKEQLASVSSIFRVTLIMFLNNPSIPFHFYFNFYRGTLGATAHGLPDAREGTGGEHDCYIEAVER